MVEVVDRKRKKSSPTNKIGAKEVQVRGEEASQATQELSASSVASMAILQRNANQLNVIVVGRSGISQKIVGLKMKEKTQPILPKKLKKK